VEVRYFVLPCQLRALALRGIEHCRVALVRAKAGRGRHEICDSLSTQLRLKAKTFSSADIVVIDPGSIVLLSEPVTGRRGVEVLQPEFVNLLLNS